MLESRRNRTYHLSSCSTALKLGRNDWTISDHGDLKAVSLSPRRLATESAEQRACHVRLMPDSSRLHAPVRRRCTIAYHPPSQRVMQMHKTLRLGFRKKKGRTYVCFPDILSRLRNTISPELGDNYDAVLPAQRGRKCPVLLVSIFPESLARMWLYVDFPDSWIENQAQVLDTRWSTDSSQVLQSCTGMMCDPGTCEFWLLLHQP